MYINVLFMLVGERTDLCVFVSQTYFKTLLRPQNTKNIEQMVFLCQLFRLVSLSVLTLTFWH
jgi:hypothetical protein